MSIHGNGDKGYMLEVDLEYSEVLHDLHSDYTLAAPETKYVPDNILSPFRRKLLSKLNPKTKSSTDAKTRVQTRRLLCTLEDKYNYVCHYRNLQLYIKLGMKLKKVHRILECSQSPFLEE